MLFPGLLVRERKLTLLESLHSSFAFDSFPSSIFIAFFRCFPCGCPLFSARLAHSRSQVKSSKVTYLSNFDDLTTCSRSVELVFASLFPFAYFCSLFSTSDKAVTFCRHCAHLPAAVAYSLIIRLVADSCTLYVVDVRKQHAPSARGCRELRRG